MTRTVLTPPSPASWDMDPSIDARSALLRRSLPRLTARHWVAAALGWAVLGIISSVKALVRLRQGGVEATLAEVALPTVGAALVWALFTPPIVFWAFAQPPARRAPWRLAATTAAGAVCLPWIHAFIRRGWDVVSTADAAGVSNYYLRYFTPDAFALVALVALAQTIIHVDQARRERERRAAWTAEAASAAVEAHRLMAQPARLRAALAGLRASIQSVPQRTETGTVLLGDLLRLWQSTTGMPEVSLKEELEAFVADRAFHAALAGAEPNVAADLDPEVRAARVPNGVLTSLLDEGVIAAGAGVAEVAVHIRAERDADVLRLVLEGAGSGRPRRALPGPRLRSRLDQLYPQWELATTPLNDGFMGMVLEVPFHGASEA